MTRSILVDAIRGVAVLWMIIFHFFFDLTWFGFSRSCFSKDPFWLHQRTMILSLFLLVSGVSMVLMLKKHKTFYIFYRAALRLVPAALLVTLASYALFPKSYIYFGVIHFMICSLLICRFLLWMKAYIVIPALVALVLGNFYQHTFFNVSHWGCFGFRTFRPMTEDYVPLFPWLGVVWLGCTIGWLWQESLIEKYTFCSCYGVKLLTFFGRHSLAVYLIHQPILIFMIYSFKMLSS